METTEALQLQPGTRFNNYQVDRLLGQGGMGAAFLARDLVLGRPVVVKVMLGGAAEDPTLLERFRREAQAGALIDSEHVVKVFEAGRISGAPLLAIHGKPFIAMQFIDGATVADVVKSHGRVAPDLVAALLLGIARGLVATHAAGIVHRDVKPANALLTRDGRVKLADLGLAKFMKGIGGGPPPPDLTRAGTAVGTAAYIAPEQAQGGAVDGRADVFALGVTFYELLTGVLPFVGSSQLETVTLRFSEDPRPPRALAPGLPPEHERVCLAFLERDPTRRPSSTDAVNMLQRLVPADRSADLAALFSDPRASTQLELDATVAKRYGLERDSRPAPAPLTTTTGPALQGDATRFGTAAQAPAVGGGSRVLPALLFALGSFFLAAGAVVVALIVTRNPQPVVVAPSAAPTPAATPAPAPSPLTRETAPAALKAAIAGRRVAKVRGFVDSLHSAPRFETTAALTDAAHDAESLLLVFETRARGMDTGQPLDQLLDAIVAAKKVSAFDDDTKAAATLLGAVEGQAIPGDLVFPADAIGGAAERLTRVLGTLGLERPTPR